MTAGRGSGRARRADAREGREFDESPFLVIWETTRACDLACEHCRAEARPERDPNELGTEEAKALLVAVRRFGPIVFVISGGDCMKRPDLVELVAYGTELGLRMAATPATTALATRGRLRALRDAGLRRIAVSIDGSTPAVHDAFRGVAGSFAHGLRILRTAQELGMSTQVNTVVARHNLDDLDGLCRLMEELGIVFWEVFFLVPTGRARRGDVASAASFEAIFHELYELSATAPFDVKATAAPHYSRVVIQRTRGHGPLAGARGVRTGRVERTPGDGIGRARGVNDGDGFLFVSHTGEIFPSGFLPLSAGNVRRDDLVDVYRNAPLFRALRDRSRLKGKCGACEFRSICGGSRARAYAMSGDIHASEPCCAYVPARLRRRRT
ncbi:MAG: TIGR04053 family radical SAM/SPASM domain-containing protein [Gemmatimonadota bacterium]